VSQLFWIGIVNLDFVFCYIVTFLKWNGIMILSFCSIVQNPRIRIEIGNYDIAILDWNENYDILFCYIVQKLRIKIKIGNHDIVIFVAWFMTHFVAWLLSREIAKDSSN